MKNTKNIKKTKQDQQRYPLKRISISTLKNLEQIGEGNWKHGLDKAVNTYELVKHDPSIILYAELERFSDLLQTFLPENHFEHYVNSNLPAMLRLFIKTGRLDVSILNKRAEKALDKFEGNEETETEVVDNADTPT